MPKPRFVSHWSLLMAVGLSLVGIAALPAPRAASDDTPAVKAPTADETVFFETKIRPILANNCTSCHGKDAQIAGLRLDCLLLCKKAAHRGHRLSPATRTKAC